MNVRSDRIRVALPLAAIAVVAVAVAAVLASRTPGEPPPAAAEPGQASSALTLSQPASGGVLDHIPKRDAYAEHERVVIRARHTTGYELTGWGGDCAHVAASTNWCVLTMDADKTVSATFATTSTPTVPTATTITTGDSGVILLEWTGGPDNATRWQYRQRGPENGWAWTAWADIPGSDASTRSFRVSGLRDDTAYYFNVRGVVGAATGEPSEEARGVTPVIDKHGVPGMPTRQIAEGGRTWRVSAGNVVIDVPAGTRLRYVGGMLADTGQLVATVEDVESGSWFVVDIGSAEIVEREIVAPPTPSGAGTSPRDVGALFDRIAASARVLPK